MNQVKEIREILESAAAEVLYFESTNSFSVSRNGKTIKMRRKRNLGFALGVVNDTSLATITARMDKAESGPSQHEQDKAAKAERIAAYQSYAMSELEIPYNVDEDRLYRNQQNFIAAMVSGGHIEADELNED